MPERVSNLVPDPISRRIGALVTKWANMPDDTDIPYLTGPTDDLRSYDIENLGVNGLVVTGSEGPRFVQTDFADGSEVIRELDEFMGRTPPASERSFRERAQRRWQSERRA